MCILCVASRLSRRIVTVLRWLVIPVIILWAFSQMLPPNLRFEVTSPRLACVFVLLVTSGWHEIILPRLFAWRARRSALMRERQRVKAQLEAKRLKEAIRRCRNCLTAFRDQMPGSGRFMCAYCGHVSRRPVLDITGVALGKWGPGNIENYRRISRNNLGTVQGAVRHRKCSGESNPGIFISVVKVLKFSFFFIRLLSGNIWRERSLSEGRTLNSSCKADIQKGDDKCNFHENKGEKARRKAKEKRQARLEKKMLEEEERKQREEVARLVEERRRLRNTKLEVEKESERETAPEKQREIQIEREVGKRQQIKQKVKEKCFGKDNHVANVGEFQNKNGNEKGKLYNMEGTGKNKISKPIAHHATEPIRSMKHYRAPSLETESKTSDHTMKQLINGITQFGTSRYLASLKYSTLHPRSSSSSSRLTSGCVERFGVKSVKKGCAGDSSLASIRNGSIGSLGLNYGQRANSTWIGTACSKSWSKGSNTTCEDTCKKQPTLSYSNRFRNSKLVKYTNSYVDRSSGVHPSQLPVGVEPQPASPVTTQTKSWQHLFKGPLTSSRLSHSSDSGNHWEQGKHGEIQSKSFAVQVTSCSPSSSDIHSTLLESIQVAPAAVTPRFSITMSVSGSVSESPDPSDLISPHDYIPAATLTEGGNNSSEDSLYQPHIVSSLGLVSEPMENFSTDIKSSLLLDARATGVLSSNCAPISAPIHRPAQTASPMSKISPTKADDNSHANGDHHPPIAELWSLPSLALDGSNEISEQGNWQYGKSKFCKPFPWFPHVQNMSDRERNLHHPVPQSIVQSFAEIENHLPADLLSQLEDGSPKQMSGDNPWSSDPDHKSNVEVWNELDSRLLLPSFGNCFREGATQHYLDAAHDNEYEQSPVNFPPWSDLHEGSKSNCSTETTFGN